MTQPTRLLDSVDASPAERALLEAARDVAPVTYDVAAGAAQFQATLQTLSTASATAGAASTAAVAKVAGVTKLLLLVVPVLGAVAAYYALRAPAVTERSPIPPSVTTPASEPEPEVPDSTPSAAPSTTADPPRSGERHTSTDETQRVGTRTVRQAEVPRQPARSQPTTRAVPPSTAVAVTGAPSDSPVAAQASAVAPSAEAQVQQQPEPTLEPEPTAKQPPEPAPDAINELRAIASARALIERDPESAHSVLQRLARAHPHGYFVEEREALTVLALAGQGNLSAARKQAAAFLKTYPTSPFADRVRAAIR